MKEEEDHLVCMGGGEGRQSSLEEGDEEGRRPLGMRRWMREEAHLGWVDEEREKKREGPLGEGR